MIMVPIYELLQEAGSKPASHVLAFLDSVTLVYIFQIALIEHAALVTLNMKVRYMYLVYHMGCGRKCC